MRRNKARAARLCVFLLLLMVLSFGAAGLQPAVGLDPPQLIADEIDRTRERRAVVDDVNVSLRARLEVDAERLVRAQNQRGAATVGVVALREARSELDGIATRLSTVRARREQTANEIRRLDEALATDRGTIAAATTLSELVHAVATERARTLRGELDGLTSAFDETADLLAQHRRIAVSRLELSRSRLRVHQADSGVAFEADPRVQLLRQLIDELLAAGLDQQREALRLTATDPASATRRLELETRGEAALVRSNLRQLDLELLRIEAGRERLGALIADPDLPPRALRDTRTELAALVAALDGVGAEAERAASLENLLARARQTAGGPVAAVESLRRIVDDVLQVAVAQEADIAARRDGLSALARELDDVAATARMRQLARPASLPGDTAGWYRAAIHGAHLPAWIVGGAASGVADLPQRISAAGPWRLLAITTLIAAAIAVAAMLPRQAVAGSPSGFHHNPPAIVLRSAPLPPLWIAVSLLLGWPASVAALGLLPVGAYAAWWLARSRHLPTAAERRALAAAAAVLGLWLLLQPLPVMPELRGVLDRLAGLAVAGLAALALLRVPTGAILEATDGLRLPVVRRATSLIAVNAWRAAAIAAIGFGFVGALGYTALASVLLGRLAGTFLVVVAVVGLLVATESLAARAVLAIRRRRTGGDAARLRREVVRPLQRILAVAIVLVGVQALVWMVDRRALPVELVGVAIILATLPFGLQLFDGAVRRLVQREGTAPASDGTAPRLAFAQRAVRALVVLTSAVAVIALLGVDLSALASPASFRETVARSALDVLIVVLMADLAWHTARASIERKELKVAATGDEVEGELARRRARLRTLLPIMRNILGIVILVTAALMALSSIGIEIGPLIAGAGVVGVAIGFGAQTLVRDVIAGVFFLLDDAFRVGEYIESGELRGTVEAFSLRSVKLRHHRGKLHTVPFGELGSITNYSRDWVIDKLKMKLALDTDIGLVKRVVKQVGKELMQDPELAQVILQPPKSQGVQAVGDGGVEFSIKVMTRPGEQFVVRRALYQKLMAVFREQDIHLATPTLRVAGDATPGEAAAQAVAEGLVPRREAEAAKS